MIWEKTVLYGLQGTLLIKKQQLEQLKNCQTELEADKKEFDDSKTVSKSPNCRRRHGRAAWLILLKTSEAT